MEPRRNCLVQVRRGERSRWTARTTRRRDACPRRDPNPEETPGGRRRAEAPGCHDPHGGTGNRTCDVRTSAELGKTGGHVPLVDPGRDYEGREARRAERQEGNGRSDAKRLPTRNILRRVEVTRGGVKPRGPPGPRAPKPKRVEPQAGSGAQQTRKARAEEAVKAVRNREDGTGPDRWQRLAEGRAETPDREWMHERRSAGRRKRTGSMRDGPKKSSGHRRKGEG